jgi:hypothetical protein
MSDAAYLALLTKSEAKSLGLDDAFTCAWCGKNSAYYNHAIGSCKCETCYLPYAKRKAITPPLPWNYGLSGFGGKKAEAKS